MGKSVLHVLAKRSTPDFGMRDKEREKRKKILKMCVQKLRDIDDPETVLCRAVLINNTFKSLKYAYRHRVVRSEPEPVYTDTTPDNVDDSDDNTEEEDDHEDDVSTDESSNSDDESVPTSSSDNESDDNDTQLLEPDTAHKPESSYCQDELDNYNEGCDIKNFSAESIVHSLMMPPLLSPQIEDMTNCSFYDNFTSDPSVPSNSQQQHVKSDENYYHNSAGDTGTGDVSGSFKFSVVNEVGDVSTDSQNNVVTNHVPLPSLPPLQTLPPMGSHNNYSTSQDMEYCQKSDFPTCVQSDIGNSIMIDNLLTEIVQA